MDNFYLQRRAFLSVDEFPLALLDELQGTHRSVAVTVDFDDYFLICLARRFALVTRNVLSIGDDVT